jgi:hypothetical protein
MWRFYGPGDELRRATWFLDTQRHGLQPYGEEAQAVLEDAYLFLKWTTKRRVWDGSILLTVEVPSPEGREQQLVQFSSLTSATAIGKGIGSAISLFKRRVFRGAHHAQNPIEDPDDDSSVLDGSEAAENLSDFESESFDQGETSDGSESTNSDWVDLDPYGMTSLSEDIGNPLSPPRTATPRRKKSPRSRLKKEGKYGTETVDPMRIYTDEVKSLRLRLSRPLDQHMQLAFSLKVEKTDNVKPVGNTRENNGSDDVDHLVLVVHGIGEMLQGKIIRDCALCVFQLTVKRHSFMSYQLSTGLAYHSFRPLSIAVGSCERITLRC